MTAKSSAAAMFGYICPLTFPYEPERSFWFPVELSVLLAQKMALWYPMGRRRVFKWLVKP